MISTEDDEGGTPIDAFSKDLVLADDAFRAKHGPAFFVRHGAAMTRAYAREATRAGGKLAEPEATGEILFRVFPLLRRPGSEFPFVSIGRDASSDVVVPDASVSKFHAYVKEEQGRFLVQDARSRNGTFLGDIPVPARGGGSPVALVPGATIRFGSVGMSFLDVAQLRGLVGSLTRST